MKRFLLLIVMLTVLTLPLMPVDVPAQNFGLEEGDDIGFPMPGDAQAAEAAAVDRKSVV